MRIFETSGAGSRTFSFSPDGTARGNFGPYAITVLAIVTGASAVMLTQALSQFFDEFMAYAAAHPDQTTITTSATGVSAQAHGFHPGRFPDIGALAMLIAA
jgi:hypothetical protein